MRRVVSILALLAATNTSLLAQQDDFRREGSPPERTAKDALEGKLPPELKVTQWKNIAGESASLADYRGQVVVLDFWGVW